MQAWAEEDPEALQRPLEQDPVQAEDSEVRPGVAPNFPAAHGVQSLSEVPPVVFL